MTEKRHRDADDRPMTKHSRRFSNPGASSNASPTLSAQVFTVPRTNELLRQDRATLSQPKEIAYFSKYASDDVRFDRSNLLAYKQPETPYNSKNEWTFEVEKRDGCVYLNVRRTEQDIESNRNPNENQRRGAFAGRRFEIYSTRPNPTVSADQQEEKGANNIVDNRKVNEDEEFCTISAMTLGDKRLVVAAEIDCYDDNESSSDAGGRQYVELKTFRLLQREKDQFVFERFKLLAFWIQSYLVGTPMIICGFRNDAFQVRKLQTFRVTDIPNFCRKHWSPVVCLNFTKALLDWIYDHATEEGRPYHVTYIPRQHGMVTIQPDIKPRTLESHFRFTMQVWKIASTLAVLALTQVSAKKGSTDKERPGICEETEDCTAKNYECVALQTTRSGTDTVKQCLPKEQDTDVCSGQFPGLCPTFSSWTNPYNQISSVCTYKPAEKCVTGSKSSSGEGVICVSGAADADGKSIDVIYGCVDFDTSALEVLFGDDDADKLADDLGTAAALVENCLSTNSSSNSTLLCTGQGTCMPDAGGSLSYTCRCNEGYSGSYCESIDSNKCQLPGQCATGVCNLETNECECAEGTTGDQCSECDATSDKACNGKGTCSDSECTCEEGWEGLQCTKESAKKKSSKSTSSKASSTDSTSNATSGAMPPARPLGYVAMAVATILATALFN
ncbi:hypothetical protein BBO99_00003311 [Phytophthora kernoviae]|uniref:Decapping nuclease n=2 Tax=Phytophthora kernoviae TaxID=325452 RepID=A0A421GUI5_9STRA|nr:hypothetical protein G195_002814 [Phytophthora kernoviae 00238/432]KAG2528363.1 hypothetical protein JM16_002930 [Phytophthora kernoviae]RLN46281.1 hypothetical protein BBI17_003324 [Phytophthora kernoviae]RLN81908.1 hypothetical protein BBO99_00003311 [Phytophthora kernoviae]